MPSTVSIIGWAKPGFLPSGPRSSWSERVESVKGVWATLLLFGFVIGGLYGGMFTATEAAGAGAGGAFIIGVARGRLNGKQILQCLLETTRTTAAVFTILIGALLFGYFLTITQTPQKVTAFLTGLGIGDYGVLTLILLMYLLLGCLMDALAIVILTVPIIFPLIKEMGFDPIWFGIIIVMTVELGLIHPPGGHEYLRHQERARGHQDIDHFHRGDPVHHHRPDPAGDPGDLPGAGDLAAVAYVGSPSGRHCICNQIAIVVDCDPAGGVSAGRAVGRKPFPLC